MAPRGVSALLAVLLFAAGCMGPATGTHPTTSPVPATPGSPTTGSTTAAGATPGTPATGATTGPGSTTGRATAADVEVAFGDLPVNASLVLRRVESLTGTEVERTVTVQVYDGSSGFRYDWGTTFLDVFGVNETRNWSVPPPGGSAYPEGRVNVKPGNASPARIEALLAHEFAHLVQYELLNGGQGNVVTSDRSKAWKAVVEGGAMLVEAAYVRRYVPELSPGDTMPWADDAYYDALPARSRYVYSTYHYGYDYVTDVVDDPGSLDRTLESIPTTTEAVVHPGKAGEPPVPLDVSVNASGSPWVPTTPDRKGELSTRAALRATLNRSTTNRAATGWGNDRFVAFEGTGRAMVWVWRGDTASDAAEFAAAVESVARERSTETPWRFEVTRPGDRTVVLVAGPAEFVDAVSLSGGDGTVTVTLSGG